MKGNLTRLVLGKYDGREGHIQVTNRVGPKVETSQPWLICLGWGSSVPAVCSHGQASGSTSPRLSGLQGSRWVIGAVDSGTRQPLPGHAAHNNLLQGYQTHCHSDSPLQFTSLISLRIGAWPGMGYLTVVKVFVCVRECELVRNNKPLYVVVF